MAVALGLVLGVALVAVSRLSVRLMTPDDPAMGFARVAAVLVARLAAAGGLLVLFYLVARPGLAYFGIALIVAFLGGVAVELFRTGRAPARSIPRRG